MSVFAGRRRTLRRLEIVSWCVADLAAVERGWTAAPGFRVVARGTVDAALAATWDTPALRACPWILLAPASGEAVWLRFIATGEQRGYHQPLTAGWCATEFLATDPDALAGQLADSGFRRLAGPAELFPGPKAPRAMQATGPADELVYFTRILPGGSRYGMKQARSFVDRPFIVTVAGSERAAMEAFYSEQLGMRIMPPLQFVNGILAAACGAAPDTVFPTVIVPIPGRRFLVELDQCPPGLPPRPQQPGLPPPGMSVVSFGVASLDAIGLPFRAPPRPLTAPPYAGRRVAVVSGAAGEWLELIELP